MTDTKEALERARDIAAGSNRSDVSRAALARYYITLHAEHEKTKDYLGRLLHAWHPGLTLTPTLIERCLQVDNATAGMRAEQEKLHALAVELAGAIAEAKKLLDYRHPRWASEWIKGVELVVRPEVQALLSTETK